MSTALAIPARPDGFLALRRPALAAMLAAGHPIDPRALEGFAYRGTSLGVPGFIVRLSWRTFQKTFHRLPDGRLVGWNVRVLQRGLGAPTEPIRNRDGTPRAFGYYDVVPATGRRPLIAKESALLIDYGRGGNSLFDVMRTFRDPLVALDEGSAERLLGWSYAELGPLRVSTPFYFLLEREAPIEYVPPHRWPVVRP